MKSFKIAYSSLVYYRKDNTLYGLALALSFLLFSIFLTLIEAQRFNMKQITQRLSLTDQDESSQTFSIFEQTNQQLTANYQLIMTILVILSITSFTILTSLFFYHRRYELATLLNVGVKKITIIGQFLIEYLITFGLCLLVIGTLFFLTHTPVKNKLVHINQVQFFETLPKKMTLADQVKETHNPQANSEETNYLLPFDAASFDAIDTENAVCNLFSSKPALMQAGSLMFLSSFIPLIFCGYGSLLIIKNTN